MMSTRPSNLHVAAVAVFVLIGAVCGIAAESAAASTYDVAQCSPGHATTSAKIEGTTAGYETSTGCASGGWLRVTSAAATPAASGKHWVYRAPAGTRFERIRANYSLVGSSSHQGNAAIFFIGQQNVSANNILSSVTSGSTAGTFDSDIGFGTWKIDRFGVGMACTRSSFSCGRSYEHQARIGGVALRMRDEVPPSPVVVGGAVQDGWESGLSAISVTARDVGAGVSRLDVTVNGFPYRSVAVCNPGEDGAGYASALSPCPDLVQRSIPVNVADPAFREGGSNSVRVCSIEHGSDPAHSCASTNVKVDNIAPEPPQNVKLEGGDGWRRDNGFDVSWSNRSQAHAPIVGAGVEMDGPGGVKAVNRFGADRAKMEELEVPSPGSYSTTARVVDAAGNWSARSTTSAKLKFDDTAPPGSEPAKANGWLSRDELATGFLQTWELAPPTRQPPSGIAGYRVAIDQAPKTDPCAGGDDPRACGGALTELGELSNSRILTPDDVMEGRNYVHVVPVSGSGVRADQTGHTHLDVDLSPPELTLAGKHSLWQNKSVDLVARASDQLSGMGAAKDGSTGKGAATFIGLGGDAREQAGSRASVSVKQEGVHELRYWARDLAGNVSKRKTAMVRIDSTPPAVAFANSQDPRDPDRIVAPASDGLSGVVSGSIAFRPRGGSWRSLETSVREDALVARVRSETMKPGVAYEFRAIAVDKAGNRAITGKRKNGTPMRVVGPFKAKTAFENVELNGKTSARVKLRKRLTVRGRLREPNGGGIADARVVISQDYRKGSRRSQGELIVRTDRDGKFSARLRRGPSRQITARFDGSPAALPSRSAPVKLNVRSGTRLQVKRKKVRAGDKVRFKGKVKAPGAAFSRVGKRVEIQVKVGKRWKAVGKSIRTNRKGKFRLSYRFVATYTSPVKFTFRAVALRESGFPYLPSKSKKRRVVVRP